MTFLKVKVSVYWNIRYQRKRKKTSETLKIAGFCNIPIWEKEDKKLKIIVKKQ